MTVTEVKAKQAELQLKMESSYAEAKKVKTGSAEFDVLYSDYLSAKKQLAGIEAEIEKAAKAEKLEAVKTDANTIAEAITKLIEGLKIAEKIGEAVKTLRYAVDDTGKAHVSFNSSKAATASTGERKATGRTKVIGSDGNSFSLTKFVKQFATESELKTDAFKYPHTQVDTKAKFEAFCKAHNLTGYTYELPVNGAEDIS